jgi:hypothetical protein
MPVDRNAPETLAARNAPVTRGDPGLKQQTKRKENEMRRLLMMSAAAALSLAAPVAMADSRLEGQPPECRQQDRNCPPQPRQGKVGDRDERRGSDGQRDDARRGPPPAGHAGPPPEGHRKDQRRPDDSRQVRRDGKPLPHAGEHGKPGLRIGDDGRSGRRWTPPRDSRFGPAPRGLEYRVIHNHLVLVDKKSRRIVNIIAPARMR